jgi:hypothetical protein
MIPRADQSTETARRQNLDEAQPDAEACQRLIESLRTAARRTAR